MCKEKYINPFTDFGFKRLFGTESNKELLIHFLNAILDDEDEIVGLKYLNTEKLGKTPRDRRAIYDIYCTTENGGHIIVEMQRGWQDHFTDRCIYYSARAIDEAADKGDWDFSLPRVYTIALLNFKSREFEDSPDFKHTWRLCDIDTKLTASRKLNFVFLEMKKFDKDIHELENLTDKWMYVLKNLYLLDAYPAELQDKIFKKFFTEAKISAFTDEEKFAYEESLKEMRDYNNTLASHERKGRAQGRAEGRAEEKLDIARRMKSQGFDASTIVELTGISSSELQAL